MLQGVQQRHDKAGAGGADRVAERAGAAVDVELVAGEPELLLRRHGDDGERLVDLVEIDVARPHPALSSSLRMAGMGAVVNHCGSWLWVACARMTARTGMPSRSAMERRVSTSAAAPSALAEDEAGVMVPSRRNAGFSRRDLVGRHLHRVLVVGNELLAAFDGTLIGAISALKRPSLTAARARFSVSAAKASWSARRELVALGRRLAEIAHAAAGLVGVLQTVEQHVIEDAIVADAIAAACLGQQVRRVRHQLHAAGDDDIGAACGNEIVRQHGGLHARAAHLVDGGGAGRIGQAGAAHGLAGGGLALAGLQHVAHQHLVDAVCGDAGPLHGGLMAWAPRAWAGSAASSPWKRPSGVRTAAAMTTGSEVSM